MKPIALISLLLFSLYCKSQERRGLVAGFLFDRGSDTSMTGHRPAKLYGIKLTEDRFGNDNSACYLQGNPDSYINLGNSPDLKPRKATISLWIKINQPVHKGTGIEHNPIIFTRSRLEDDFNEAFYIGYHLGLGSINVNTSCSESQQITLYPTQATPLHEWHHVAMTYDDDFLCFYIDGVLDNKAAKKFETCFLPGDSVLVGKRVGPKNNRYLHASVDDIFIYNRVLSPAEIMDLYRLPNPNRSTLILGWILLGLLIVAGIVGILMLIRWRVAEAVNSEKKKNQLRNRWYEQENRVLTAQMDPHFIFNSLNTISQFIIVNDNEKAQLYLSKFSRLMRKLIENNAKENISLADEIETFGKYIEIESLRFNNVFNYNLLMDDGIDPMSTRIHHFFIQPFIENAIWHGLLPKEGDKQLTVSFKLLNEKALSCTIDDNGVGRTKRKAIAPEEEGKRSLAIAFIQQRLQVMSRMYEHDYGLEIIDKTDTAGTSAGTKVTVIIPVLNN